MQNEFEKEVRQKLEELRLQPSPPVWEEVAWQIRPERRRRRVFFWWLAVSGLLVGGIGLYTLWNTQQPEIAQEETVSKPVTSQGQTNNKQTITRTHSSTTVSRNIPLISTEEKQGGTVLITKLKLLPNGKISNSAKPAIAVTPSLEQRILIQGGITHHPGAVEISTAEETIPIRQAIQQMNAGITPVHFGFTVINSTNSQEYLKTISTAIEAAKARTDSIPISASDSITKLVRYKNRQWRKMVTFNAGVSGYNTSPLSVLSISRSAQNGLNSPLFSSPGTGTGINTPQRVAPNAVKQGFSFSVGVGFWRDISSRVEVSVGLAYSLYTTRQPLGKAATADTVVSYANSTVALEKFYTAGNTSNFTNRFHAVSLPIGIHWQMHKRLPLFASINAAYSRFIGIRAVAYSSSSNLYFDANEKKDVFNKNQSPVSVGLSYRFRVGKEKTLAIGPVASYSLLRLNNTAANGQHLSFIGIHSGLRF